MLVWWAIFVQQAGGTGFFNSPNVLIGGIGGTVIGLLAWVMRRQHNLDKLYQVTQQEARESLEEELERARSDLERSEMRCREDMAKMEARYERRLRSLEDDYLKHKQFAHERIRHLEKQLYGQAITPPLFGPEQPRNKGGTGSTDEASED